MNEQVYLQTIESDSYDARVQVEAARGAEVMRVVVRIQDGSGWHAVRFESAESLAPLRRALKEAAKRLEEKHVG
jgi:hypothetical protein